jgi:hypothetical protein
MVAAGTGATVGITLYVIGEGRYEPDGFAGVNIDFTKLNWDWLTSQSNYASLRSAALASGDGAGWLTSFAQRQAFVATYVDALGQSVTFSPVTSPPPVSGTGTGTLPSSSTLSELYFAQASANAGRANVCPRILSQLGSSSLVVDTCRPAPDDAGTSNGGTMDGSGAMDATSGDARSDATPSDASDAASAPAVICDAASPGTLAARDLECGTFTDISAAMIGLHPADVWVTRLESNLPRARLNADLQLVASQDQTAVTQIHRATTHVNPPCQLLEDHPEAALLPPRTPHRFPAEKAGIGFVSVAGILALRRVSRRKR